MNFIQTERREEYLAEYWKNRNVIYYHTVINRSENYSFSLLGYSTVKYGLRLRLRTS